MPRGWSWVDPLKEVKAYREAEQAGYMTKAQVIAYSGGDFDDNVNEIAREQQIAADAGIKLDKDLDLTDETCSCLCLNQKSHSPLASGQMANVNGVEIDLMPNDGMRKLKLNVIAIGRLMAKVAALTLLAPEHANLVATS